MITLVVLMQFRAVFGQNCSHRSALTSFLRALKKVKCCCRDEQGRLSKGVCCQTSSVIRLDCLVNHTELQIQHTLVRTRQSISFDIILKAFLKAYQCLFRLSALQISFNLNIKKTVKFLVFTSNFICHSMFILGRLCSVMFFF